MKNLKTAATLLLLFSVTYTQACGAGWEQRIGTNDCFRFEQTAKTWDEAKDACVAFGGALTTIYNEEEQNYLTEKLKDVTTDMWIGLVDEAGVGIWRWVDKSCVDYINWNTAEPNYMNGDKDCVALLPYSTFNCSWNDNPCSNVNPFICRKKMVGQGEVTTNTDCDNLCKAKYPSTCEGYIYENDTCTHQVREFEAIVNNFDTSYVRCRNLILDTTTEGDLSTTTPTSTTTTPTTITTTPTIETSTTITDSQTATSITAVTTSTTFSTEVTTTNTSTTFATPTATTAMQANTTKPTKHRCKKKKS